MFSGKIAVIAVSGASDYMNVAQPIHSNSGRIVFSLSTQQVIVNATTWSVGSAGIAGLSSIRDTVRDRLDEFINAWLSVNPK